MSMKEALSDTIIRCCCTVWWQYCNNYGNPKRSENIFVSVSAMAIAFVIPGAPLMSKHAVAVQKGWI